MRISRRKWFTKAGLLIPVAAGLARPSLGQTLLINSFRFGGGAGYTRDGLVGEWLFDEGGTGTTCLDTSGNGNNGTMTNMDPATDRVAGPCGGGALDFDGINDFVEGPVITAIQGTLLSCFVRARLASDTSSVLFAQNRSGFGDWNITWSAPSRAFSARVFNNAGSNATAGTGAYPSTSHPGIDGLWYMAGFTFDGANVQMFVDGAAKGTPASLTGLTKTGNTYPIGFASEYPFTGNYMPGQITAGLTYNRALTAAEISEIHNYFSC